MKALLLLLLSFVIATPALQAQPPYAWARSIGGATNEQAASIAVDLAGNVYSTGQFRGTVDFDPGPAASNLTSAGQEDIFVTKFTAAGAFVWARSMGGADGDEPNTMTIDVAGNVFIAGVFEGTADFDPGAATVNLASAGNSDIFICKLDATGGFAWAKAMGGSGTDVPVAIALDPAGNVYSTGFFASTADFDPGPNAFTLTTPFFSAFVSKLDASGNFVWARSFGKTTGFPLAQGNGIAIDASHNVYTTGYFVDTTDFDPGPASYPLVSAGGEDIFVSKLDSAGGFIWARRIGGDAYDQANAVVADATGSVYVTGFFNDTVDFDPGAGATTIITPRSNAFVLKLNSAGDFPWAKRIGGDSASYGYSIVPDIAGGVCVAGDFRGTADFDPGAANFPLTAAGGFDAFMMKLDAAGSFAWATHIGGTGDEHCSEMAIDAAGNLYASGYFEGNADFDPGAATVTLASAGQEDAFVLKLGNGSISVPTTSSAEQELSLYPNPATTSFTITSKSGMSDAIIRLQNISGQTVGEWRNASGKVFTVDVSAQPAGVYLVEVVGGSEVRRLKLIKR